MDVIGQTIEGSRFDTNETNFINNYDDNGIYDIQEMELPLSNNDYEYMNGFSSHMQYFNHNDDNEYIHLNQVIPNDMNQLHNSYNYNHEIPNHNYNIKEDHLELKSYFHDENESDYNVSNKSNPKRRRREEDNDFVQGNVISAISFPHFRPPLRMIIDGVPPKSRVEKQIKMSLKFVNKDGSPNTRYKYIFLNENQLAPFTWKKKNTFTDEEVLAARSSPHLTLRCRIMGSQSQDKEIIRCVNCVQRELKTFKKKTLKLSSNKLKEEVQREFNELLSNEAKLYEEKMRIIQFYTGKFVEIKNGEAILPLRITCYCRHHKEPHGFSIQLFISDGNTHEHVMSASTSYILITDDHKTTKRSKKKRKMEDTDMQENATYSGSPASPLSSENSNEIQSVELYQESTVFSYVEKVIPKHGPLSGGVEVTVLGKNFLPHHICYFGEMRTSVSHYWNAGTIVCLLPPSTVPGPVPVSVVLPEDQNLSISNKSATFVYSDDDDKKILELALQLVGVQFTGQLQDAKKIAMDIVHQSNPNYSNNDVNKNPSSQPTTQFLVMTTIKHLVETSDDDKYINLSIRNSSGHTLLHYAIMKGYLDLFYTLLDCNDVVNVDLNLNSSDKNGNTPLHFAVLFSQYEMATELLYMGAIPYINNESGDIPIDYSEDEKMREILEHDYTSSYSSEYDSYITNESYESDNIQSLSDAGDTEAVSISMQLTEKESESESISLNIEKEELEDTLSEEISEVRKKISYFWMAMYHWIAFVWNSYRFPVYIGLLVILGGLLIVEFIPFRLSKGVHSPPGSLLTDGRGNVPHSAGNDTGLKLFTLLANLPLWQIYFAFRWLIVCSIFVGIVRYFKLKMNKLVSISLMILIFLLFVIGLLYIFHAIG